MIARHYLMKFSCIIVLALGILCLPDTSHANPSEYYENHQTSSCNSCSSGACSSTCNSSGDGSCCCCLTSHIENYNGDPSDLGSDYELKVLEENDLQASVLDPNKSELTIVADTFEKSPWEVYLEELEKSNFKDGTKWLVRTMAESGLSNNFQLTPPARIPRLIQYHHWFPDKTVWVHKDLKNDKRLQFVEKEYLGQRGSQRGKVYRGWYAMFFNIRNTNGEIVGKTCFYRSRWIENFYSRWPENRASESISEKQNNPLELYGCIPNSWLSDLTKKERLHQLRTSREQNARLERELVTMDILVGITPFLSTADEVAYFYQDPHSLTLESGILCAAGLAGDVFLAGGIANFAKKIGKAANIAATASKAERAVHMGAFLTGAAAATVSGYSIFTTAKEDWDRGITFGRASFFALEVLGLLLDKDAHLMMAPHIKRSVAKMKLPAAIQSCRNVCSKLTNDELFPLFRGGFATSFPRYKNSVGGLVRPIGSLLPGLPPQVGNRISILKLKVGEIFTNIRTRVYGIRRVVLERAVSGNLRARVDRIQAASAEGLVRVLTVSDADIPFEDTNDEDTVKIVAWGAPPNASRGPESAAEQTRRKLSLVAPNRPDLLDHIDLLSKKVRWFEDLEPKNTSDCFKQEEMLNLESDDWMLLEYYHKETKGRILFLHNIRTNHIILFDEPWIKEGV